MRLVSNKPVNNEEKLNIDRSKLPKVIRIHTLGKEVYLVVSNTLKIEIMNSGKVRLTNKCLYTDVQIDNCLSDEERKEFFSKVREGMTDDRTVRSVIEVKSKSSTEMMCTHIINAIMITENEIKILQETEVSSYSTNGLNVSDIINKNFNLVYEIPVQNFRCSKINL